MSQTNIGFAAVYNQVKFNFSLASELGETCRKVGVQVIGLADIAKLLK